MATYLDRILAVHRARAAEDNRPVEGLVEAARRAPEPRPFRPAVTQDGLAVIAELKRRSPSRGDLAPELDPAAVASSYAAGGAACLSVLTDARFFGGSPADLGAARRAVDLPVLRKDFTVSEADVCDARLMGADAVLLIVAALADAELVRLRGLARELGLAALIEVHDEAELERALDAGADLVGVNQRDLTTFEVDHQRAEHMAPRIPGGVVKVAESGVRGAADAARLAGSGFDAVLVGESLIRAPDRQAAVRSLLGEVRASGSACS
ncbi:MAG TPA: indole-3-glycerol phosphate synthase TrpC [Acidimicrobiia bacterium]|jgi:indole-3-glycerol phosphate synthase